MPTPFFHLHLDFSNSCVRLSKHVYAFPSSSILIHTYCHIHSYILCPVLYLSPSFCFLSYFSTHLIDTYVTVSIDVRMALLTAHMPRLLPICIFISHLPPTSRTLMFASKYTYIFQYILLPLVYEPLVPLCLRLLLRVNSCVCVSQHVYAFPSSSIFMHTYRHIQTYALCSVLYYLGRCKTSSVGQSVGLLIPRSSVRFRQKLKKSRTQTYMDLNNIDPQAIVLNYCYK